MELSLGERRGHRPRELGVPRRHRDGHGEGARGDARHVEKGRQDEATVRRIVGGAGQRDGWRDHEGEVLLDAVGEHRRTGLDLEDAELGAAGGRADLDRDGARDASVGFAEHRLEVVGERLELRLERRRDLLVHAGDALGDGQARVRRGDLHVDRLQAHGVGAAHNRLRLDVEVDRHLDRADRQRQPGANSCAEDDAPLREADVDRIALPGVMAVGPEEDERAVAGLRHRVVHGGVEGGRGHEEVGDHPRRLRLRERWPCRGRRSRGIHRSEAGAARDDSHEGDERYGAESHGRSEHSRWRRRSKTRRASGVGV